MKLLGILNLTPDSFSDGNAGLTTELALKQAEELIADGAAAIDVGAESTRPGAKIIPPAEEWARLEPFIKNSGDIPLSIDTRNFQTALNALKFANVKYLNDVSGLNDERMVKLAADSGIKVIVMHSITVPADKNIILTTPVIPTLQDWMKQKHEALTRAGITADKIIFDPGIGFGKNPAQSMEIINAARTLADTAHSLGTAILYGHSRKSFLGQITSKSAPDRDEETARISRYLHSCKVDYIRVHNVAANATSS